MPGAPEITFFSPGQCSRGHVLFIGTNNAARTQMAEGYLRARYCDRYDVCSAGIAPTALDPLPWR
ncbi:hypothetical protein [Methanoculleus sp.]|uniref:hypothetical protein n=1 Tax=Methanoculleus sp. TaxID=90427 RepID=UPI0025D2594F|nr:hypothetical protein [Methanoculleus sp.]MCK9319256.1 hypothetical protein [Methanoculleus sp.]